MSVSAFAFRDISRSFRCYENIQQPLLAPSGGANFCRLLPVLKVKLKLRAAGALRRLWPFSAIRPRL